LPDAALPAGSCFETKAFPEARLSRYRITKEGRLIDSVGRDLEVEGYVVFYAYPDPDGPLLWYRARFIDGQLQSIVRGDGGGADLLSYELASFRWFAPAAGPHNRREFLQNDHNDKGPP